jgi:hypothetical protein
LPNPYCLYSFMIAKRVSLPVEGTYRIVPIGFCEGGLLSSLL